MTGKRLKTLAARALEAAAILAIVLLFFGLVLKVMNAFFPIGTGLRDAIRRDTSLPRPRAVERSAPQEQATEAEKRNRGPPVPIAALLATTKNDVRNKPAQGIAWQPARPGMKLYDRDAIQTLDQARAVIAFDDQSHLDLGENSLVVLRRLEEDVEVREKRSVVVVFEGELLGRMKAKKGGAVHLEVNTPNATARVRSRGKKDELSDFRVSVNPDRSSTVAVFSGSAEVTGKGKTVRVEASFATVVDAAGVPSRPRPLPPTPTNPSPASDSTYYYRELPPRVRFTWDGGAEPKQWRFVLARDENFREIVADEPLAEPAFVHGNLKSGVYYWRVSSVDGWTEGAPTQGARVRFVQDLEPPALEVEFPPDGLEKPYWVVRGKAEPGSRVFVAGQPVGTDPAGAFEAPLTLERGINVIVVEAVDLAGNVTYRSARLNARF